MRVQIAQMGQLLDRGVYTLPAKGPNGEMILFAVTSGHCLTPSGVVLFPIGADYDALCEGLFDELERVDPASEATRRVMLKLAS